MAHSVTKDETKNSSFAAFWSALLFAGLIIATVNFIKSSSGGHDNGGHHETEAGHHGSEAGHLEHAVPQESHESPAGNTPAHEEPTSAEEHTEHH